MIHRALRSSLIKFIKTFADNTPGSTTFLDLDSFRQHQDFPDGDLAALNGFTWVVDGKIIQVLCSFGISTLNDPNLFRHAELIDSLATSLMPEETLSLIHPDTGDTLGWMVVQNGTTIQPIEKTDTRAFQFIQVSLLLDRGPI